MKIGGKKSQQKLNYKKKRM